MALALTPRLLRRGLELFAVISLAGVIVVLVVYGENLEGVVRTLLHLHWWWMVVGLGLASMDWIGGGTRLWVVARHVRPGVRLKDMIIAGGMSAWAAYLTPFQSGAGPTMMWVMRRAGVRLPEGLAGAVLGRAVVGPVARQQAARGIRRAARARYSGQLRRHPPPPDVHHLPPLLRTDARVGRARRVSVRGGHADLCRARAAAVVRAHLAFYQQLRHGDRRIAAVLV